MVDCTTIERQTQCTSDADCAPPTWCVCGECGIWGCQDDTDCPDCAECGESFTCVEVDPPNGGGGLTDRQKLALGVVAVSGAYWYTTN